LRRADFIEDDLEHEGILPQRRGFDKGGNGALPLEGRCPRCPPYNARRIIGQRRPVPPMFPRPAQRRKPQWDRATPPPSRRFGRALLDSVSLQPQPFVQPRPPLSRGLPGHAAAAADVLFVEGDEPFADLPPRRQREQLG